MFYSPPSVLAAVVEAGLVRRTPRTIVMPGLLQRELADIRRTGVAFEREESARGIACVACPVIDQSGRAVAAVSVTGWMMRMDVERMTSGVRTTGRAAVGPRRTAGRHARCSPFGPAPHSGAELTEAQALELYQSASLHDLGSWASAVTLRMHPQDYRTYVIDRNGMIRRKFIGAVDWSSPEITEYLSKL